MQVQLTGFNFAFLYKFPGDVIAHGDHFESLIEAIQVYLRQNYASLQLSKYAKTKTVYPAGQFSQFQAEGVRKEDNVPVSMLFAFLKHKQVTYCIVISLPKEKYDKKAKSKITQMLNGVRKLKS